jgi:hypothetical protein
MTEQINHSEREHAFLSASSAHRWLACPPSAVANEAYPDQDTEYTREGTLAHEVAEVVARVKVLGEPPREEKPEGVTQEMIECAEGYADYIQEQLKTDDAVVLLEQRVDFSPWVPEGFGTCDCIIIQGDTLTITDYKYGQGVPVSAVGNPQMKYYALGAINDFGIAYNIKKVEMHIYQPRLNSVSDDSLTVDELMKWGTQNKPIAERAFKGKGKYNPGEHCRFCQHAGRCRALTKTCTEYVEAHSLRVGVPVLAQWEIADVLRMEPLISLWLKKVKEQAVTALMNGEEVPGYKLVEGKQGNRKWANEYEVYKALNEAGYKLEEFTETKLFSPSAMDKVLGKKKVAELLEAFIERAPGQPTVVPETDKRPAYDRLAEARRDFD